MASTLLNTIQQNKQQMGQASNNPTLMMGANGELEQTAPQSIQALAAKAGLPNAPTSPIGAAALGANPDQQKMAGTQANLQSSLKAAQNPSQTLQQAEATQQVRSQATASEQAEQQKAQDLQGLGNVGTRVQEMISSRKQALTQAPVQLGTQTSGLPAGVNQGQLKSALGALQKDPSNLQLVQQVNQLLGRNPSSPLQPAEIDQLYGSATDAIVQQGGATMGQNITVSDLEKMPNFGYSADQLSQLLGVPSDQLAGYNLQQLQSAVNEVQAKQFSSAQQLGQQATSTDLGSAERAQAHQLGQEASATGVHATEAQVKNVTDAVNRSDQITFNGQKTTVGDLLGSDTVSKTIQDYLNAPAGSQTRADLDKNEPQLSKFINDNQQALSAASAAMDASTQQYSDIQRANQGLMQVGNTAITSDLMKQILPGFGQLSTSKLDPSQSTFLTHIQGLPQAQAEATVTAANSLSPDLQKELGTLSQPEVAALHLEMGQNSPVLQVLTQNQQAQQQVSQLDSSNPDAIVSYFTGGEYHTVADAQKAAATDQAAKTLGFSNATSPLDTNGDGKIDPSEVNSLLSQIKSGTSPLSLKDAISGKTGTFQANQQADYAPNSQLESTVMQGLGDAAASGKITAADVAKAPFTEDDLYAISDAGLDKKWGDAGKTVADKIAQYRTQDTNRALGANRPDYLSSRQIQDLGQQGMVMQDFGHGIKLQVPSATRVQTLQTDAAALDKNIANLQDTIKQYGRKVDSQAIQQRIDSLQDESKIYKDTAAKWDKERNDALDHGQKLSDSFKPNNAQDGQYGGPGGSIDLSKSGTAIAKTVKQDVGKVVSEAKSAGGKIAQAPAKAVQAVKTVGGQVSSAAKSAGSKLSQEFKKLFRY